MKNQKEFPIYLLFFILVKSILLPTAIFDAVAITSLVVLFGFKLFLDYNKKPDFSQEMIVRLNEATKILNTKIDKISGNVDEKINIVNGKVSAVMLNAAPKTKKPEEIKFGWG